jgi:hypothetical protein
MHTATARITRLHVARQKAPLDGSVVAISVICSNAGMANAFIPVIKVRFLDRSRIWINPSMYGSRVEAA